MNQNANDLLMRGGIAAFQGGRLGEAEEMMRRAIGGEPGNGGYWGNLGIVLRRVGKLEESIECYRRAIELVPGMAEGWNNLGNALRDKGDMEGAIAACREALRLRPEYGDAWNNLGNCLQVWWKLDEGVAAYREALRLKPGLAETWNNLGNALKSKGRLSGAGGAMECYREAMRIRPGYAEAHSGLIYAMQYVPGVGAEGMLAEARAWDAVHGAGLRREVKWEGRSREVGKKLRVGYVSPDFRGHPIGMLLLPVLEGGTLPYGRVSDREQETLPDGRVSDLGRIEVFCYSDVLVEDGLTERLRGMVGRDRWRNIVGVSDERVVEMVREDGIDVLVDLTMHMARNRLKVFARRAAPVQATWLAYPGTTGMAAMDYRVTDVHLDPVGGDETVYSEKTVRLAETFWCYAPIGGEPEVNALPAAAGNDADAKEKAVVTFGCLNNFCKVNEGVLKLWARVMREVKGSRMIILAPEGDHREWALGIFAREGIDRERIEFVGYLPRAEYLRVYHRIDIGLDTFPYNGHTTSLDSFFMGVPVVTLVGETVVGRAGLSQLMNLGLPELVARTEEEYVRIAVGLAGDLPRLGKLRVTLRERMRRSALMDGGKFARNLEGAYWGMWERWCAATTT